MKSTKLQCRMAKAKLIDILREQLRNHRKEHAKAMADWRKVVRRGANSIISQGEQLKSLPKDITSSYHPPQSYEESIQRALNMLENSSDRFIVLSHEDYCMLVEGEWDWRVEFANSVANYDTLSKLGAEPVGEGA